MRTADEMAGFIIEKVLDASTMYKEEEKRADVRMNFRLILTDAVRSNGSWWMETMSSMRCQRLV